MSYIEDNLDDTLFQITDFLSIEEILNLGFTCRRMHSKVSNLPYNCPDCQVPVLSSGMPKDSDCCSKRLCFVCAIPCSTTGNFSCSACSLSCPPCGDRCFCCVKTCEGCNTTCCRGCGYILQYNGCSQIKCNFCLIYLQCSRCDAARCDDCFDDAEFYSCRNCGRSYCIACRDSQIAAGHRSAHCVICRPWVPKESDEEYAEEDQQSSFVNSLTRWRCGLTERDVIKCHVLSSFPRGLKIRYMYVKWWYLKKVSHETYIVLATYNCSLVCAKNSPTLIA